VAAPRPPRFPWGSLLIGVLAIFGVIYLIGLVSGVLTFLLSVAVVIALVVIVSAALTRGSRR